MLESPLLRVHDLTVIIEGHTLLESIDLTVSKEEIVTLIGPNGAGKTTLLRAILGFVKPSKGSIDMQDHVRIGYMPQKMTIDLSVVISVERFLRLSPDADLKRVKEMLHLVRGDALSQKPLSGLSGGELQRVLLAKALMNRPQLLILDEPVQGVDIGGQDKLYQLIEEIRTRYKCAILIVSHDLHFVMATSDHVVCINHHICCAGSPDAITSDPQYQKLFPGQQIPEKMARYTHHHDHVHDEFEKEGS